MYMLSFSSVCFSVGYYFFIWRILDFYISLQNSVSLSQRSLKSSSLFFSTCDSYVYVPFWNPWSLHYWTNMKDCHFFPVSPWVQVSLGRDCGTIYPIALWNDSELFVSSSAYSEFLNYWICHLRKGAKYRGRDDNWSKWLNMSCSNHFSIIIYLNVILYQPT